MLWTWGVSLYKMRVPEEFTQRTPAWSKDDLHSDPHHVGDKSKRVEQMFTAIARKYDLNNRLHSLWQDQVWRQRAVKMANLTGDEDVVDVACGTGDLAMAFCTAGVKSVIGVDFTQAMLEIAVNKAAIADLPIEFRQGDAMHLDLPDCSADVVSIAFGIRNVQDPETALAEFYRILRPSGKLVVLEFSTPQNGLIRALNNFYTKKIMPLTATLIAQDTSGAYKYLPKSVETFSNPTQLAQAIKNVGFQDITQQQESFGVCTISVANKYVT